MPGTAVMKCVTIQHLDCDTHCDDKLVHTMPDGRRVVLSGTLIDQSECPTADCVRLVKMGLADPADDECRTACRMTPEQIAKAQLAQRKLMAMLPEPEDTEEEDEDE